MPRLCGTLAVLLLALLPHAGAAYGASTSAVGDPPTGSPAGAVYELPFERGRAEAAPKGSGGTDAPGAERDGGGGDGSPAGGGGGDSQGAGPSGGGATEPAEAAAAEAAEEEGSLYRSENNFGSSSHVPGTPQAGSDGSSPAAGASSEAEESLAQGREAAQVGDAGNTSPATNIALLGVIALIALGSWAAMRRDGPLRTGQ
jgi:hypothetical protein